MAENESLDLGSSRRWVAVLTHIRKGEARDRAAQRILGTLQKAWQTAQKQFLRHGTSLREIIDATLQGENLADLLQKTRRHDYVNLFDIEQRSFDNPDALLQRVVAASLDRVFDQFRHQFTRNGPMLDCRRLEPTPSWAD